MSAIFTVPVALGFWPLSSASDAFYLSSLFRSLTVLPHHLHFIPAECVDFVSPLLQNFSVAFLRDNALYS